MSAMSDAAARPDTKGSDHLHAEREVAERLAREAGALLRDHLRRGLTVDEKTPDDPVTAADREASELIVSGLFDAFPHDGVLSEEAADNAERLTRRRVWIIDPIDGTREYVAGTPDYCVSIGLAIDGRPALGVVYAPAAGDLYSGVVGVGVWKNGVPGGFSDRPLAEAIIAVSDTEHARELSAYALPNMAPSGSIAYKLARVACGEADATFTINPRSEWDIAAGMALVEAAGGVVTRRSGSGIPLNATRPRIRRGLIGGRPDVVAWLRAKLLEVQMPEQQLYLKRGDSVWTLLPEAEAERLAGKAHLHVRHKAGQIEALILIERRGGDWDIERAEGDPFALRTLATDLQREYGRLDLSVLPNGA